MKRSAASGRAYHSVLAAQLLRVRAVHAGEPDALVEPLDEFGCGQELRLHIFTMWTPRAVEQQERKGELFLERVERQPIHCTSDSPFS